MMDEQEPVYWSRLVIELQTKITIAQIGRELGVPIRVVWLWRKGARPMGTRAVKLYMLHVKLCSELHV